VAVNRNRDNADYCDVAEMMGPGLPPVTDEPSLGLYDRLLANIGERAADVGTVVTHWPHVGSAYRGRVIVGEALHGWQPRYG